MHLYRLLRWSERYTKTDMVYVGRSGFWLMLGQMISTLTSFVLSILFARYLSKETFGIYKYILSVAGFVSPFSLTGMNTAIVRAVSQGRDGTFARSLPLQLRWALGQCLINFAIAGYYLIKGNTAYAIAFGVIAVFGPISTVTNSFASYLQGKQDFKTSSTYGIFSSGIYFLIVAGTTLSAPNFVYLIVAYFVSTSLTNAYFCVRTLRKFPAQDTALRPDDVRYAKHLSLMTLVGSAANQIDSIIVYQLLGPAQLAIYAFSTIVPDRIRGISSIIMSAALPKLSKKATGAREGVPRKLVQMMVLATLIIVVYIISAPIFYQIFFPEYSEAVWYSQVYALSLFILPSFISLPTLYAQQNERALYVVNIGIPFIKILISFSAIVWAGILGAVLAKVAHYILHMALSSYYATTAQDVRIHEA
jgi:O-antigen/teichoic acid export membrane protein